MRRIDALRSLALSAALILALGGACGTSEEDTGDTGESPSVEWLPPETVEPFSFEGAPPDTDEPPSFEWTPPNTDELPSDTDELPSDTDGLPSADAPPFV